MVFAKQNVITDPPFSKIDLISCRNLLIYFSQDLQRKVLKTFHFALKPNGKLFLGKSESAVNVMPELYDSLNSKSHIFVRKNIDLSQKVDRIQSANNFAKSHNTTTTLIQSEKVSIEKKLEQILLKDMVPVTVAVDESGQILHIRGDVNRYLSFPQGKVDTNIVNLSRDDIKVDVRALLTKAKIEGSATSQCLFYSGAEEELLFINIRSFSMPHEDNNYYLIAFLPTQVDDGFLVSPNVLNQNQNASNEFLNKELDVYKERLQTSVEELETTNEELQSTNEELQSANEELQSTNEELETSNEELQSTKEELQIAYSELRTTNETLQEKENSLENR